MWGGLCVSLDFTLCCLLPNPTSQVAAAFPGSQLAEVGLCRLQEALLPPAWGFAPGSLPPIGASPDALIRHRLPPAGNGSAPAGAAATGAGGEPGAAAVAGGGAAGGAAAAAANGSVAAAAPPALGPWNVDALLGRLQLTSPDSVGSSSSSSSRDGVGSSSSSGGGGGGAGGGGSSYLVEVVEVKNTCPFGHSRRCAGKRGPLLSWRSRCCSPSPACCSPVPAHMLCLRRPRRAAAASCAPPPVCCPSQQQTHSLLLPPRHAAAGAASCARLSLLSLTAGRGWWSRLSGCRSCSCTCCAQVLC